MTWHRGEVEGWTAPAATGEGCTIHVRLVDDDRGDEFPTGQQLIVSTDVIQDPPPNPFVAAPGEEPLRLLFRRWWQRRQAGRRSA